MMSTDENGKLWEDPDTSEIKPELSCPSGAQRCLTQNVWYQERAASYKNCLCPMIM